MPRTRTLLLAGEAAVALTGATLAVRSLGQRRLMRTLGRATPAETEETVRPERVRRARRVAGIVDRVADLLPWHPVCLPRALATRALLRRRGIACELHLGITGTAPLAAHAWVTAGGAVVQGGPIGHITPLATLRR
ncbi:hypothetical protein Val02_36470 [Virgisporangium aliadipatigenens]|uniref:Microcin J25-processing protein McjB C-terminal domain-containing protein n=1 Tax=Virgisporangium aliadipatigenens TaxID=741659 RepID=A0A8J3YMW5_9ACTN|nr:lasso peptide biosynthesis B2 protein [Virgisporangium aliadipatigenens]GIJ46761.1 hypothetical protein Val02_36470 [Virgisporangium aliadipatigenens]